jgi:hypothetical protein
VGDTVTISATVRNFSNLPATDVKVQFFQGYPSGANMIGEATVYQLDRPDGPKMVSIDWTASGAGKQKIYAVIDPADDIEEVHDEDDLINNNMAYGRIQIGAAGYGDMGLATSQAYQSQTYTQTNSMIVSAYIPPDNLDEIVRFELKDANLVVGTVVGNPFELAVHPGSLDWEVAEDYPLQPQADDPPAAILVDYAGADLSGFGEANLKLYRLDSSGWVEATCSGYEVVHFLQEDRLAVPVCQSGIFALSDETPHSGGLLYLPLINN